MALLSKIRVTWTPALPPSDKRAGGMYGVNMLDTGMIHIPGRTVRDFVMLFRAAHNLKHELFILEFF